MGELEDELWERVLAVNLTGTMYMMRKAVNVMLAQKSRGNIVNIASVAGLKGCRASSAYTVSKHGVVALTEHTAYMYLHELIRVNAICPGGIRTDMAGIIPMKANLAMQGFGAVWIRSLYLERRSNIADAVLFVSSEDGIIYQWSEYCSGWRNELQLNKENGKCI